MSLEGSARSMSVERSIRPRACRHACVYLVICSFSIVGEVALLLLGQSQQILDLLVRPVALVSEPLQAHPSDPE